MIDYQEIALELYDKIKEFEKEKLILKNKLIQASKQIKLLEKQNKKWKREVDRLNQELVRKNKIWRR